MIEKGWKLKFKCEFFHVDFMKSSAADLLPTNIVGDWQCYRISGYVGGSKPNSEIGYCTKPSVVKMDQQINRLRYCSI
jgi:hypothetical protein